MSDTNSWNYFGNTGGLAVKSKYSQPEDPVVPVPTTAPDAGGATTTPDATIVPSTGLNPAPPPPAPTTNN